MKKTVIGMLAVASVGVTASLAQQAVAPQAPVQKSWTDSVTLKGDLRYRYETINVVVWKGRIHRVPAPSSRGDKVRTAMRISR